MKRAPKTAAKKERHDLPHILTDKEVAATNEALKVAFGESFGPILKRSKIDVEKMIRFMSLSGRAKTEREKLGLTIKEVATSTLPPLDAPP